LAEPLPPRPQNDFPTSRSSTPPSDLHSAHLKSSESRRFHTDSHGSGSPATRVACSAENTGVTVMPHGERAGSGALFYGFPMTPLRPPIAMKVTPPRLFGFNRERSRCRAARVMKAKNQSRQPRTSPTKNQQLAGWFLERERVPGASFERAGQAPRPRLGA
jgi:hypothetical protein